MRQKDTTYNFFKSGRSFYYRDIFSGSFNEKMSPALSPYYSRYVPVSSSRVIETNSPSLTCIPKRSLDSIIHYLLLQEIKKSKLPSYPSSFPQKRHRYFLFQYHKNFQLINRLKGSALCLLQTQFTKKPKNPI
jgi:hypothetical protein